MIEILRSLHFLRMTEWVFFNRLRGTETKKVGEEDNFFPHIYANNKNWYLYNPES